MKFPGVIYLTILSLLFKTNSKSHTKHLSDKTNMIAGAYFMVKVEQEEEFYYSNIIVIKWTFTVLGTKNENTQLNMQLLKLNLNYIFKRHTHKGNKPSTMLDSVAT